MPIPTFSNLCKKEVAKGSLCNICAQFLEIVGNASWGCSTSKDVWSQCYKKSQKLSSHCDYFLEILSQLFQLLNKEEMDEVALLAKHICKWRNFMVHNKGPNHPNSIIKIAKETLCEFRNI